MSTPSPVASESIALLTRIAVALEELLVLSKSKRAATPAPAPQPNVASDSELDSQYGDEQVKFKPRDWIGAFVKGQCMSESDPAMLDQLAATFDYFAGKNDTEGQKADNGTPKSTYDRRSARRARGWAERLRAGWKPATPAPQDDVASWPEPQQDGPTW